MKKRGPKFLPEGMKKVPHNFKFSQKVTKLVAVRAVTDDVTKTQYIENLVEKDNDESK